MLEVEEVRAVGKRIRTMAGLATFPVGVSLLAGGGTPGIARLEGTRYCQALMWARHGESVLLDALGLACPAAARAFGFRPLPEKLASGEGLVSFGIVGDPAVGRAMFHRMPVIEAGTVRTLQLSPLERAERIPDVVVVEDEVERLMWIALAGLNAEEGRRIESSTAILQAACVDSTVVPFLEDRMNLSYGCYGCRDATDMAPGEAVLGFPLRMLLSIERELSRLGQKAMPASRAKRAYESLKAQAEARASQGDCAHRLDG
jgi:uncharacterized protein (DUF169 family)